MSRTFTALALALLAGGLGAQGLSKQEYLEQVRQGNRGFKAMQAAEAALKLAALEPDAMLSPYLSSSVQYFDDQVEPSTPFGAERTTATQWDLSLNKQFGFTGTRLSLGYKGGNAAIKLPAGLFGPGSGGDPFYWVSEGFNVSLNQPLWRDFGARNHGILKRKIEANTGAARLMNRHGAAALLFEAEAAFHSLAAARQVAALLEESLERNRKILDWTKAKFADNLADKVDVLQVEAALRQVEMGLAAARHELKNAGEKFNTLKGEAPTAEVGELAASVPPAGLPGAKGDRLDLKAAELGIEAGDVMVEEVKERFVPDIALFASASATGGDRPAPLGKGEALPADHPTYLVGLRLNTTLDLPLYFQVLRGAKLSAGLSRDDYSQKKLKAGLDWESLKGQWDMVSSQLKLATELEAIQKEKAEREKKRYLDGRTTNFQVLRFDEDYAQARINTIKLSAQASLIQAQADFYNGGGIQW